MKKCSQSMGKLLVIILALTMMTPVGLTKTDFNVVLIDYPPSVTVKTPASEDQIFNGIITIDWLATDIEDDDASLDIAIEYSPNGGSNWFPIMAGTDNNYPPYLWNSTAAGVSDGVNYLFKVIATDNKPNTIFSLSRLFSIDNVADDRWYLQVESTNLGTLLDLDMKPSEPISQGVSVFVPSPGEFTVQSFASEYVAHCEVDLVGDWNFSIYAKVSSVYVNGSLYASVYADDGITSRLLFTTDYDDETVGSQLTYHEFFWVHPVPPNTMLHAGEHVIVEIMLHATDGSGPSTLYHYANADIPVNGTVSGDYSKTRVSDYRFETIDEIHRESGDNATFVLLDEDFSGGIPGDWTVIDGGFPNPDKPNSTWTTDNPGHWPGQPPITDPFAIVDACYNGPCVMNETLITPVLNFSFAAFVTLEFDQFFVVNISDNGIAIGDVDVNSSLTGGTWQNVFRNRYEPDLGHVILNISTQAAGAPDVQIRYHYYYYQNNTIHGVIWEVDNVLVHAYSTTTLLEHKWTINVPPGGDPYEFSLEASRPDNPDFNNFTFAYSTDDVNYTDMITVDYKDKKTLSYWLPPGLSGTVWIRVTDTDRVPGKLYPSRIEIDEMFISSFQAGAIPISNNFYVNADIPVLGNVTGNYTRTLVGDNIYEGIDEVIKQENVLVTVLEEDFSLGIPFSDGWQVIDGGKGGGPSRTWNTHNHGNRDPTSPPPYQTIIWEPFAIADAEDHRKVMDEQLITPVLDLSTATTVRLTFDDWFVGRAASDPMNFTHGRVQIRSNLTGGLWQTLLFHDRTGIPGLPGHYNIPISSWAAGASDVEIRFHYVALEAIGWWMVDNVKIEGFVNFPISLLDHRWTIDVPDNGAPYVFSVKARRNETFDTDNFIFSYSTNNVNFKDMITVILPDVVRTYTYALPPGLSGTVYIRVTDSDRTLGNDIISRIEVDEMFISSVHASQLTLGLDYRATPSYVEPTLSLGPIAHICIQDAPGGTGANVTTHNMTTDDTFKVWSVGYDGNWNYMSEIPTNWTNTLNAQTATSTVFTLDPTAPGSGTITAVYNTTLSDTTGLITVTLGLLADILIRDSPGGIGNIIDTYSMTTDDTLAAWAAGYDADGNYISDVVCNWSTNGTLDAQSANDVVNFTFDPSTAGTSGYINAITGTLLDSTGLITVGTGALDYVVIRYNPGGLGPEVGDVLIVLGQTLTVYSAGYDAEHNYIGDIPCNWTTTGTLNLTTATSSSSFSFKPAITGETGTINASFNSIISDETGTITVTEFEIDYIVIEDGLGNEVTTHSMNADETYTVWAIGYNLTGGAIGPVNANWTTTGSLDLQTATQSQPFTFDPIHAPTSGTIEAIYVSLWDTTGTIIVNSGPLTHLCIQDAPGGTGTNVTTHSMTTDETYTVWAIGYDAEWNYIGEINCDWTTTGTLDLQTATGVNTFTFSPTSTGIGTFTADDLAGHMDSTGLITVITGAISYIIIRDSPGGIGNIVGPYPMTTDDTLTLWAAGYDAEGNYIGDVNCNWSTNETLDTQSANDAINFIFDPSTSGTSGYIIAVNGSLVDSAGQITVGVGALDHIVIRHAPGGAGSEVTVALVIPGENLTVYSAGYDADNNYIGDIPCNWTTTGTLNLTTATNTPSFTFEPAVAGENGTINATFNGTIYDETGVITVTDHRVDTIVIVDDDGQLVSNHWMDTTETLRVWAMGWNISTGPICPIAADWITTGTLDLQTANFSASFTFAPIHAPTSGSIEASFGTLWDSTQTIFVELGPLAYILIQDAPGGVGANVFTRTMTTEEELTVWSVGYDAKGNYIGDINCDWTTTGTLEIQNATGVNTFTFSPTTTGMGTITADDLAGHMGSTGLITVNTGAISYILIRNSPGGLGNVVDAYFMTTDNILKVWAAAYDAERNFIGDADCNWSTNETLDAHSAFGVNNLIFDPSTENTTGYIIAVNGTFSDSAGLITVGAVVLKSIVIRNAPGGAGIEVADIIMAVGETLTLYSAGYDNNDNYVGEIPCDWTTTGTLNLTTTNASTIFAFEPAAGGESGTIIATYNATISDETGTIDVANLKIDLLVIVDNLGTPVNTHHMDTTETLRVWAMGWNHETGPVSLVPADWTTTGTLDLQTAATTLSFTFDPIHAPTSGTIEASFGTLFDTIPTVIVDHGPLAHVCIHNAPGGTGTNVTTHTMTTQETFTVWSIGYDAEWNFIPGGVVCDWTTTGTLDLQNATGVKTFTFSPLNPGTGTITADYNATINDATGIITVTYPTYNIDITEAMFSDDWILISFPCQIEGDPLSIIVDAVDEGAGLVTWDIVQWFDPQSAPGTEWKTTATYKPPFLNTFTYVNNSMGFWIHITNYGDGNLTMAGPLANTSDEGYLYFYAGWNLVGYPFPIVQPSINTFGTSPGIDDMYCYDSSEPYRLGSYDWLSTEIHEPGRGYWVHVAADEILVIMCP